MKLAVGLFMILGVWVAWSWGTMLLIGDVHLDWWSLVPSLGYRASLTLNGILILGTLTSSFLAAFCKEYFK